MKNFFFKFIMLCTIMTMVLGYTVKGQAYLIPNNYGQKHKRLITDSADHIPLFDAIPASVLTNIVRKGAIGYNTVLNRLYVSSDGLTYDQRYALFSEIPTSLVSSVNTFTGAITIANGTGIGLSSLAGTITISNTGVLSFGGQAGAITTVNGNGISITNVGGAFTWTNTGVTSINGNTGAFTNVWQNGGNNFGANPTMGTTNNTSVFFKSNNTNYVRLVENGNFIISTGLVDAGYKLDVVGGGQGSRFAPTLIGSSGEQVGLTVNPTIGQSGTANYVGLLIDASVGTTGSVNNYLTSMRLSGSDRFRVTSTGRAEVLAGISNTVNSSQGLINFVSTGIQGVRNIADANPLSTWNQSNGASTGDIMQWLYSSSIVGRVTYRGFAAFGTSNSPSTAVVIYKANPSTAKIAADVSVLKEFYTSVPTVAETETDLMSYTTEANIFSQPGDKITAEFNGQFAGTPSPIRQLKVYFGGNVIFDSGLQPGQDGSWKITATLIRDASSRVRCMVQLVSNYNARTYTSVSGITFTSTNILKVTGTVAGGGGGGEITGEMGWVYYSTVSQ